jgi:hypothetical protein
MAARLRRTMAIDATCWHGVDPRTLLLTTASPEELLQRGFVSAETLPSAAQAFWACEYERGDYNTFAALARRRAPVGILSEATRGRPQRGRRYREFLGPLGMPYEMRTAFVTRGRVCGCVVFHRSEVTGDFQQVDARLIARLSRPIAEGLRTCLRVDAARRSDEESAPGMVVLGPHNEVELITPPAHRLLEPLHRDSTPRGNRCASANPHPCRNRPPATTSPSRRYVCCAERAITRRVAISARFASRWHQIPTRGDRHPADIAGTCRSPATRDVRPERPRAGDCKRQD